LYFQEAEAVEKPAPGPAAYKRAVFHIFGTILYQPIKAAAKSILYAAAAAGILNMD
jgi:hypothetical protein